MLQLKFLAILALAASLHAQDAPKPDCAAVSTPKSLICVVDEIQAKVAEQSKEIGVLMQELAEKNALLNFWTQTAILCQGQPTIQQTNMRILQQMKMQARQIEQQVAPAQKRIEPPRGDK